MTDAPVYTAERVRQELVRRLDVQSVRVDCEDDAVRLSGDVATEARRSEVERVVRELLPDRSITNEVAVPCCDAPTEAEAL